MQIGDLAHDIQSHGPPPQRHMLMGASGHSEQRTYCMRWPGEQHFTASFTSPSHVVLMIELRCCW